MKIKNSFCFIIDHNDSEIMASSTYLTWFYNVIFRIPVEFLTEKELVNISFFNEVQNCMRYSAIFLLSIMKGKKPKEKRFWEKLEDINQKIPILTFYRGAEVISNNIIGRKLFNLKYIGEKKGNLKNIAIKNEILKKNIRINLINESLIKERDLDNDDKFVLVNLLQTTKNFSEVLLEYQTEPFGIKNGLNIFIGEKFAAIPREDYALEFNRAIYHLNLLENLLHLFPSPVVKMRLKSWPVCFRIDDFPSNWDVIRNNKRVMNHQQLAELINFCKDKGVKITAMVTPACISNDGLKISWIQSKFENCVKTLDLLKQFSSEDAVEIGLHGYAHVTLGKQPKTLPINKNNRFLRVLNTLLQILFKQKYLASEFYDRDNRREIPYSLQESAIKLAKNMIIDYFGTVPKVFTPPQHMWDSSTESILVKENIPFLSCDMCFYKYPAGYKWRKNPSPIGFKAYNAKNLLIISGTILAKAFPKTLELYHRLGIPFVLIKHNWAPDSLSMADIQQIFEDIQELKHKKFMKLSELGNLLRSYEKSSFEAITDENNTIYVELDLKTPVELYIDDGYEIIDVQSLKRENFKVLKDIILLNTGIYSLQVKIEKKILNQ